MASTRATSRRSFLQSLAGGAVATAAAGCATFDARRATQPPNIIFILADDLGYGDLGCYGQRVIQTPHLDRMAAEGMRFTQCYAGSTVCAPSRCALMTGLHTGHCFVRGNKRVPLRPEDTTVAELLRGAGYTTGLIGKWGLGNEDTTGIPRRQGFDYFFGYLDQAHAHNYYPEFIWRNEERVYLPGNVEVEPQVSVERNIYTHDLFTDDALQYVERHRSEPFFLYLSYTIPHANNERGRAMGDGMEVPDYGPYADEDWPFPQKGHAAMITRMDRDIGRLFAQLQDLGIDRHTLVLFSSDNGPHREGGADPDFFQSSGPLRGIKRALYEGGIRVPGIARWPGYVPARSVSDQVWAFWDFLPTATALAGVPAPPGIDGISILPTLLGDYAVRQQQHPHLYWEFHEGGFSQAVRLGDWKAVRPGTGAPIELYNLAEDIGETRDVAAINSDVVAQAQYLFQAARTQSEEWPVQSA